MKLISFIAGALLAGTASLAGAQPSDYPNRPVRIVVPWPAGGVVDGVIRLLAPKLSETLRQNVVVDNRAGGAGLVGAQEAARAAPDGYTLLMVFDSLAMAPAVYQKMPMDPFNDLAPISLLVRAPLVGVSTANFAPTNIRELVAYAKANPNTVTFGSTGVGSSSHLTAELFAQAAGVSMVHVPYKGGAPAQSDLMGGHLQLFWGSTAWTKPMVDSGKVRALGQAGQVRSSTYPDLPTLAEQGYPDFRAYLWMGISAPKGTPDGIVARWNEALRVASNDPNVRRQLVAQGFDVVMSTPAEFGRFMREEHDKWARVIREAKIPLQ
ncbi:MAG: Bug family tripartite tricarboxylate transporter substrate binding protein [Burkholderiaceae bacterium]